MNPRVILSLVPRVSLSAAGLLAWCLLFLPVALRAQSATGTITGRVLNSGTGQYLRSAIVTVPGTNLSAVTEAGGAYTLSGVPVGQVKVSVAFVGLDNAESTVTVTAGSTVVHDVSMSNSTDTVITLGEIRVVTEREGNYKAIQDQKAALEMKSVVASDAFGDISEGNVGEFLKLMPGVMMDYVDADVRQVSVGGLDPKYAAIMIDGAPVASAGSSNIATGRAFEFEQLSISSIETVELSKTPTPDVAGSALAGVVNLRSKGAFDRKGRQVRWSTSAQINSHHLKLKETPGPAGSKNYKFQPNVALEFSDVFMDDRLGVLAGVNFSRTFVEQNITNYDYAFDTNPANNATEVPRVSTFQLIDAPKTTNRTNYNLRLDYKVSPHLNVWVRGDFNDYEAINFMRNLTLTLGNAVNGPATTDPRTAGIDYSLSSQTTTNGTAQLHYLNTFNKHGETATFSAGGTYKRGAFRADVQAQGSRSTNYYHDVDYGYFHTGSAGTITGLGFRFDRAGPSDAGVNITQLSGLDLRNPASYTAAPTAASRLPFSSEDQRWVAKADFRYDWSRSQLPMVFKWGGDISEQVRDVERGSIITRTYLGPDGVASTGDERYSIEPYYRLRNLAGGNLQSLPAIDRFAMAREYGAHPERFTQPTPAQILQSQLTTHWDVKEQIDSLYQQTIIKVSRKFELAPGVRMERTRGNGRGPTDRGDDYAKRVLTGNPNANIPTTSLEYIQARYGSDAINATNYHTWLKYLHATYRLTNEFVLRASFNDSITRPNLDNLAGGVAINPDVVPPTARIPNPTLKPEHGRNLFLSAEYYFPKGRGYFTMSGARRDISQLIRSNTFDVPVGGSYPNDEDFDLGGYRVTTSENVGKAHVTTGEFSYRQNLVFLPSLWRNLSIFGNYTRLHFDDYENFRRPQNLTNGGVTFDHRGLSLRWNVVWVPTYRSGSIPANGWVTMQGERLHHDVQLGYRISRLFTVFATGRNVFNRPQRNYWGPVHGDIVNRYSDYGSVWTVGVRGVF